MRAALALLVAAVVFCLPVSAISCSSAVVAPSEATADSAAGGSYSSAGGAATLPSGVDRPLAATAAIDVSRLVPVPDPLGADNPRYAASGSALPAVAQPLEDSQLGTTLARVTARPGVRHEYSRFDPFNADRSMVILLDDGFKVFKTEAPYDRVASLVRSLDLDEPRWDRAEPQLVTGISGFRIVTVNVVTGEETLVKDFSADGGVGPLLEREPDLYRVTCKDEGEPSSEGRWWALAIQGSDDDYRLRYLLCWDHDTDRVVGLRKLAPAESSIDWVGMSANGTWVIIGGDAENGSPLTGLTIADRGLGQFHRVDWATGHADVGVDVNGDEVIVMQNARTDYVDLIPLSLDTKPILESGGSYTGSGHIPLMRLNYDSESPFNLSSGVHVSCNAPGWALVSTTIEPGLPENNWLDRSLILVRLDPDDPRCYYVSKTYNTSGDYWEETHATLSNDGSTVVWAANFGIDVGSDHCYLVRLDLPR